MKKGLVGVVLAIFLIIIMYSASSQIYLGSVEGYIHFFNGSIAPNASVTVEVDGKTGTGSAANTTSQANGYYAVSNLDLDQGDTVTVTANYSVQSGSNTGIADQYQTAIVNVTMIAVPSMPILQNISDTHNKTLVIFNWTNGTDPFGRPIYNNWQLIGEQTINNATQPINVTGLDYGTYTWRVQTCNVDGCSAWATDTFELVNNLPGVPTLTNQGDTNETQVLLNWSSGGADADGDPTYFEIYLDGNVFTNVTAPYNWTGLGVGPHTWKVRECDPYTCSNWATDSFSVVNDPPTEPSLNFINSTDESTVSFSWNSGIDPSAEETYDEFRLDYNGALIVNATSPVSVSFGTDIGYFTWSVRTCDVRGACSDFSNESFIHYACPPPAGII